MVMGIVILKGPEFEGSYRTTTSLLQCPCVYVIKGDYILISLVCDTENN